MYTSTASQLTSLFWFLAPTSHATHTYRDLWTHSVSLFDNAFIRIDDRVLIGPGVCICTGTHQPDAEHRRENSGTSFARPIIIEADCWIGARATILDGVRIGSGSTIAAGAVVTHDIDPHCLAGGVPARIIRRFENNIRVEE